MATKKTDDNPDILTPEQQAARDAGLSEGPPEPPAEVAKGELTDSILHGGKEWPRGTKASALKPKLKAEEVERLEELGKIAGTGNADE